jgi:hypothetical protein
MSSADALKLPPDLRAIFEQSHPPFSDGRLRQSLIVDKITTANRVHPCDQGHFLTWSIRTASPIVSLRPRREPWGAEHVTWPRCRAEI